MPEPAANVVSLLADRVVDEGRYDDERLPLCGGRVHGPVQHCERPHTHTGRRSEHHDGGPGDSKARSPVPGPVRRLERLDLFGRQVIGLWSLGRFDGDRRFVRRVAGHQKQLVALLRREAEHLGAPDHVLPVAGPAGHSLPPADEGQAADADPARQLGVTDPGPRHVCGQKLRKTRQLLQLRNAIFTECNATVVRIVHDAQPC